MPSTSEPIVQQIRLDFETLLTYVTAPEAATQTAYTVELTLFRQLLALGASLLRLFIRHPCRRTASGARSGAWRSAAHLS